MPRGAFDEQFDIVDQLIGQYLHGTTGSPGDVRCQDEIGQPQVEQGVAQAGQFGGEHIEAGAWADLVVVDGDPTQDGTLLGDPARAIRMLIQGGRQVTL